MNEAPLFDYMDSLYAYAMVLRRDPAEAGDLVQETYLRALMSKERLRPTSNVKSWLFTILRNIWLNQLRHERAAPKVAELDSESNLSNVLPADTEDPFDVYAKNLQRERVRTAITRLPAKLREIVILREYEELSYQQIGEVLKLPLGTVTSRLARARSKLGVLLSLSLHSLSPVESTNTE
jgi:RNA polymerase sigma-70 factor, ECF subfamily